MRIFLLFVFCIPIILFLLKKNRKTQPIDLIYQDMYTPAEITALKKIQRRHRKNPIAHFNIGYAYFKNEQYVLAKPYLEKAVKLDPEFFQALKTLANLQSKIELFKDIDVLEKDILEHPDKSELHHKLSVAYNRAGRYQQAIEASLKALKSDPKNLVAYLNLAVGYEKTGALNQAIDAYNKALGINPQLIAAQSNICKAYLLAGNIEKAKIHYETIRSIDPATAQKLAHHFAKTEE